MEAVSAPWTKTSTRESTAQVSADGGCPEEHDSMSLSQTTPSPWGECASRSSSLLSCFSCLPDSPIGDLCLHHAANERDCPAALRGSPWGCAAADQLGAHLLELLAREEEEEAVKQNAVGAAAAGSLTGAERANLVNWMASAAASLGLADDVLFSSVSCLDALCLAPGAPDALMSAAACLWIAAKWAVGARAPPASAVVAALPACTCGVCASCASGCGSAVAAVAARRHLLRVEGRVLRTLSFTSAALRRPTVESFVQATLLRLRQLQGAQATMNNGARGTAARVLPVAAPLCLLLAEESLLESQLLAMRPSTVAAGCIAYAHALLGAPLTADDLAAATGVDAATASHAAGVLRAVHSAVASAAAAGNPYAASLRWAGRAPAAVRIPPIESAADPRLLPLAAVLADGPWLWVLPAHGARVPTCGDA